MELLSIASVLMASFALWLALAAAGALPLFAYARRVERGPGTVPERLRLLNNALFVYAAVLGGGSVPIVLVADLPHMLTVAWPALSRTGTAQAFVGVLGFMVLTAVLSAAWSLAIAPTVRRVRDLEETPREGAIDLVRGLALLFLPIFAFIGATHVFSSIGHGDPVIRALGQTATFALIAALAPFTLRVSLRTYRADDAMRSHLLDLCARHNVRVRDLRLFRSRAQKRANALFVGIIPSRRYVYVSDYLVDNFTGLELDAVMAHEICHGKEHHLVIRVVIVAGLILLGSVLGIGLLVLWLMAVALGVVGRAFERRADDYAARTLGRDAMVGALRQLAALNDATLHRQGWGSPRTHPTFAQRIKRLGGTVDTEEATARRAPRLPVVWRLLLPTAWVMAMTFTIIFASESGDTSYYSAVENAAFAVTVIAVIFVPFAAAFGWRWAPIVSVVGATCALVVSYADARQAGEGGPISLTIFGILLIVSLWATLDRRVRSMTWHRPTAERRYTSSNLESP